MSSDCVSFEEESSAFFPRVSTAGWCVFGAAARPCFLEWRGEAASSL